MLEEGEEALLACLSSLSGLTHLDLSDMLVADPAAFASSLYFLRRLPKLASLRLAGLPLGSTGTLAAAIPPLLRPWRIVTFPST